MRIAQLAPLWETIPPVSYGGTELVVSLLTEALVKLGHEVVLFAASPSKTQAEFQACSQYPLRELSSKVSFLHSPHSVSTYPGSSLSVYYELQLLDKVFSQADGFDVIHNHLGFITLPCAGLTKTPVVTTLHGAFRGHTLRDYVEQNYFMSYSHLPFVSISHDQRKLCPTLNYVETIYHGIPIEQYQPSFEHREKGYLAFLGRFCADKGPHHAIRIAKETGWNLIMAGKVDCEDEKNFFEREIEPYVDGHQIQYVGELNHAQKVDLLKNAAATLCPVGWPEPFGLVLIESMACGTPVLALHNGAIPEIVAHEKTGFVMETVDDLVQYVSQIQHLDRRVCRNHVEKHFSVQKMVENYVNTYCRLLQSTPCSGQKGKNTHDEQESETMSPDAKIVLLSEYDEKLGS